METVNNDERDKTQENTRGEELLARIDQKRTENERRNINTTTPFTN